MTFTLALKPRHQAPLSRFVASRHAALRLAAFMVRYAPSVLTVKAVRRWARAQNLRVSSVSADRMSVRISGSSAAVARALDTHFATFSSAQSGRFTQITSTARLPKARAALTLPTPTLPTPPTVPGTPTLPSSLSYPSQYGPKDFWSMYDAPSTAIGAGQQLAIITEGDVSQPTADLTKFESTFGLPTVTWNQINVGATSTDTSGDDEWDLDSQYSTGFAPGVSTLDVYVGPSLSDQDILNTVDRWVTDDKSQQGSFSAGECELLAYAAGFMPSLDSVLQEADSHNQTMFFSSGDTGTQCPAVVGVNGVPAGIPDTNYPAASPYGIGVGGTSVLSPSGPSEIAWYAGGGGAAYLEPTPGFQSGTTYGGTPLVHRGVPDVSLDADPESGYEVIVSGTETVIGGTSASAPSWQGIWASVDDAHTGLGFAGPILYQTEPATAYHDIQLGSNGFPALPGWDYATGLGTPDIAQLVNGA
jgi:pseudomonalisin